MSTVTEECGDEFYDPSIELCCNGKPQLLMAGASTKCCDKKSYDGRDSICCDGKISKPQQSYPNLIISFLVSMNQCLFDILVFGYSRYSKVYGIWKHKLVETSDISA